MTNDKLMKNGKWKMINLGILNLIFSASQK